MRGGKGKKNRHPNIAEAIASGITSAVTALCQQPAITTTLANPGGASSSATGGASGTGDGIVFSRSKLQAVIDQLGRAQQAAEQASTISQQAAKAYSTEANNIASCKMELEHAVMRAAFS